MEYYNMNKIPINHDFFNIAVIQDGILILILKMKDEMNTLTIPSASFTSEELIKRDYSSFFNIHTTNESIELFIISKKINKEQIDTIKELCIEHFHDYKLSTFEYDDILNNNIYIYYHNNTIMIYGKKDEKEITFYKLYDRWYELMNH